MFLDDQRQKSRSAFKTMQHFFDDKTSHVPTINLTGISGRGDFSDYPTDF